VHWWPTHGCTTVEKDSEAVHQDQDVDEEELDGDGGLPDSDVGNDGLKLMPDQLSSRFRAVKMSRQRKHEERSDGQLHAIREIG